MNRVLANRGRLTMMELKTMTLREILQARDARLKAQPGLLAPGVEQDRDYKNGNQAGRGTRNSPATT